MTTVTVTNHAATPQQVAKTWLAPGETQALPLAGVLPLAAARDLTIHWDTIPYTPSLTDGRLTGLALLSPYSLYDGYGLVGALTARELLRRGVALDLYQGAWLFERDLDAAILAGLAAPKRLFELLLAKGPPDDTLGRAPGRLVVNHAMWESTRLPDTWAPLLNRLPLAIVPSTAQVQVYRDSGVTCPITVVPDPLDLPFWNERPGPADPDHFTVVAWGRLTSRKMPVETVMAFQRAFPYETHKHHRLEFKTNGGEFGSGKYRLPTFTDPRITIHDGVWSAEELRAWVAKAHCVLALTHGEGFGHTPAQAMALGVPAIVCDHSGPHDLADDRYTWPIPLDPATPYVPSRMGDGMEWWQPALDAAVDQLRAVYDHPAAAQRRATAARRFITQRCAPAAVVDALVAALTAL